MADLTANDKRMLETVRQGHTIPKKSSDRLENLGLITVWTVTNRSLTTKGSTALANNDTKEDTDEAGTRS